MSDYLADDDEDLGYDDGWDDGWSEGWHEANEQLTAMRSEVASVLSLLDGLAEQWGDEAVFRRCRDRLRKAIEEKCE